MADDKRTCKVCGKEYKACKTPNWGVWRWQDVACCREHGQIYLVRITESRKKDGDKDN